MMSMENNLQIELPFKLEISFKKIYDSFVKYASDDYKTHPFHLSSKVITKEIEKYPILIEGVSDFSILQQHTDIIESILEPLFPQLLQSNEIKAAGIPFSLEFFKYSERFQNILNNAGDDFEFKLKNFSGDLMYIHVCTLILDTYYGYKVDIKRPFIFDIPDLKTGIIRHYRAAVNGDFHEITATERAPKITKEDYYTLLDNFDNIALWKEKFPPNSYLFRGFGILNLFDVTVDESIAGIRSELLKTDGDITLRLESKFQDFFNIKDLRLGFSIFSMSDNNIDTIKVKNSESLLLPNNDIESIKSDNYFCSGILENVFQKNEPVAISNVKKYRESQDNKLSKQLRNNAIGSILIIPVMSSNKNDLLLIEIASPRAYELNSINQYKLTDIIPAFKITLDRTGVEYGNILEASIQEKYTSIHPTVKWRFLDAAEKYQRQLSHNEDNPKIDTIDFKNVHPLYGQLDIKDSSLTRNNAIKDDLTTQLSLASSILLEACKEEKIPVYEEFIFRIEECLKHVRKGLKAGDEIEILNFLKNDIYPIFDHIKNINPNLETLVSTYTNRLDTNLQVIYEKRKAYENSVDTLNAKLISFIDKKQKEAQRMFPHYFERYKTDGIEYNIYIGQSLVNDKKFNNLYLYNLRLWQLQLMYDMENVALMATKEMTYKLRVASLILVHSNTLDIKYRMDEKQFDVDGAYNIRYEIIKKRIDKAHIKGTKERITVPGKLSIIYSQENDAKEYLKYIKFLKSKGLFGTIEKLDLEDLQGVSGLKALRVEIIYQENAKKSTLSLEELIQEFK